MHRHKRNVLGGLRVLGQAESYILKAAVVLRSGNKTGTESEVFSSSGGSIHISMKRTTAVWGYLSENHYIYIYIHMYIPSKVRRATHSKIIITTSYCKAFEACNYV